MPRTFHFKSFKGAICKRTTFMRTNIAKGIVFSLNVNHTDIFTVNLDLFHMRSWNILCISNLDKIFTHRSSMNWKAEAYMAFYLRS